MTAGTDGTVRLWDAGDRHRRGLLTAVTGHPGTVFSAVFGPDGRLPATGGEDSALRVWDITDPRRPGVPGTSDTFPALADRAHRGISRG